MNNEMDWDRIRRYRFVKGSRPTDWPADVRPLSLEGLQLFGIDSKGQIYWEGQKLQTVTRLSWFERMLAGLVTIGTVSMAATDLLRFLGWGTS